VAVVRAVLPALPSSIRAFAVTQRGHGDADKPVSGYGVEDVAAAISGSLLVAYEGTGHIVHWEQPERTAADIASLVDRGVG
jgi:pimeloyl-ACP methyl ester carboxylesterase